jgi:transcriptional regulator with XRE-family HTH domain
MDVRRRLGLNVQRLRRAKGWSQEELADRASLHRTYVSGVERGIRNPTLTVIERLAVTLGASLDTLVEAPRREAAG